MTLTLVKSESLIRCARGAWGNRTHSWGGIVEHKRERIWFTCYRDYDREAPMGQRCTYEIVLGKAGRGRDLTAAKWDALKAELRREFKRLIVASNAQLDAQQVTETHGVRAGNRFRQRQQMTEQARKEAGRLVSERNDIRASLVAAGRMFPRALVEIVERRTTAEEFAKLHTEWKSRLDAHRERVRRYWHGRKGN